MMGRQTGDQSQLFYLFWKCNLHSVTANSLPPWAARQRFLLL
jgi:hypothetical protein